MSSFSIRSIREISGDQNAKFLMELAKKLSKFTTKDQLEFLEDKEDVYTDGQDFETVLRLHDDDLSAQTIFTFDKMYYPPFEPDDYYVRLWIRGTNLGNKVRDYSAWNLTANLFGEPLLVDGAPFDDGIKTSGVKSIALRFNRPTSPAVNSEYIQVIRPTNPDLDVAGLTTGISYFIRFRAFDLAQQGSINRTLFEKIDGATIQDAVVTTLTTDGRITFTIIRSGVAYSKETAAGTVSVNTVYDVWFTFDQPTKTMHVYVNNTDKTLTDRSVPTWQSDTTDRSLWIGQRGKGLTGGFFYGDLYDFRLYRELVVSSAQVGYHYTNKWTIADIPFGQVCITNYCATYYESMSATSFTSTSFTSTSFTT